MFRLSLFTITAALVALTATGCIEGPQMPPGAPAVHTSFATADQADSGEASPFCDETEAHLNCAIACERLRFCDVASALPVPIGFAPNPMSGDPLGECIWTCTTAVISADGETAETSKCLVESGGDCAEVHACVGGEAPAPSPAPDAPPVQGSGFDAEAQGEETPECFTDSDCPSDALCDETGACEHLSQSPVANVMQCETTCDALDACGGIDLSGGSFHLCFTQCLAHSADPQVVDTVHCVLDSTSCEEVVGCVEDHHPIQTPEFTPEEEETSTFSETTDDEFQGEDTDTEPSPDPWTPVDNDQASETEEEQDEAPAQAPQDQEEQDDAPAPSAQDQEEQDEAPAQASEASLVQGTSPGPEVCVAACSIILPCADVTIPHDACIQSCMDTQLSAQGIDQFLCLLEAHDCDQVMACAANPQAAPEVACEDGAVSGACGECICEDGAWSCDEAACAQEAPHEITCSIACETIAECNGEEFVDAEGFTCFERCTADFFSPVVQEGINCVFDADDCGQVLACVADTEVLEPQGYEEEDVFTNGPHDEPMDDEPQDEPMDDEPQDEPMDDEPNDEPMDDEPNDEPMDDEPNDEPMDDEPQDEPMDDEPNDGHPCFGPEHDPEPEPMMGCGEIHIERELMITDLSVVNDPTRTFDGCEGTPMGPWTFGSLMTKMAGDQDPSAFVMNWLEQWTVDQELNGFVAPARDRIQSLVIDPWLDRSGGETLDLAQAPFRLLAIANRVDLRNANEGDPGFSAGEGRFVFGLVDPNNGCTPREFVIILEYGQKADTLEEIQDWAHAWHALGAMEFGEDYNEALEGVTEMFAGAGMDMDKPNGSSINQIRTNEVALNGPWELREFRIQQDGHLAQVSVKQEPGAELRNSPELAQWINDNEEDVLNSTHTVPSEMLGPAAPVQGVWATTGVNNPDARHSFGLNTCSGCHQSETGTPFLHVSNRSQNSQTQLSGFLVGGQTNDPVSGDIREFNDLERRMLDLCNLVNPHATAADVVDVDPAPACAP